MGSRGSGISGEEAVSFGLMLAQFYMFILAIYVGAHLLAQTTSSCTGFRFLGITFLVFSCLILVMLCIFCATECGCLDIPFTKGLNGCLPIYLLMAGLAIFMLAVSSQGGGTSTPGITYKEYDLISYSEWMQNKVKETHNWDKYYKTALVKSNVCSKFTKDYALDTLEKFHTRDLSPFESGCCKPPNECVFNYTSPTIWKKSENQSYSNMDCYAWDNDLNTRCFNCQSCKASFVQDLTTDWFWMGIVLVIVLVKHILVFICLVAAYGDDSSSSYRPLV